MITFLILLKDSRDGHFNEFTAKTALKGLKYTEKTGMESTMPKWEVAEIEELTKDLSFPDGTTLWDKWVAYNSFYADTCKVLNDGEVLKAAYEFYFNDEDYTLAGSKILNYMCAMKNKS